MEKVTYTHVTHGHTFYVDPLQFDDYFVLLYFQQDGIYTSENSQLYDTVMDGEGHKNLATMLTSSGFNNILISPYG